MSELSSEGWSLIRREALLIATTMRQNTRFRMPQHKGAKDLLKGFVEIRKRLTPPSENEMEWVISCFVEVVTSAETTGPMTGAALMACFHFIRGGILRTGAALGHVIEGVLSCQFEQTDVTGDEIVIGNMLEVLVAAFQRPEASVLEGTLVIETLMTVLRVNLDSRFTEMLRKRAETSLFTMISEFVVNQHRFLVREEMAKSKSDQQKQANLWLQVGWPVEPEEGQGAEPLSPSKHPGFGDSPVKGTRLFDPSAPQPLSPSPAGAAGYDMVEETRVKGGWGAVGWQAAPREAKRPGKEGVLWLELAEVEEPSHLTRHSSTQVQGVEDSAQRAPVDEGKVEVLASVLSLLVKVVDPSEIEGTRESLRCTALELITQTLGSLGPKYLLSPPVLKVLGIDLVTNLLCIAGSALVDMEPGFLASMLSCIRALYDHMKLKLKGQLEMLFVRIYLTPLEDRASSDAVREVLLEGLIDLCALPSYLSDLYINYDCCLQSSNLFERTIKCLCKYSFPMSGMLTTTQILSFRALIAGLEGIQYRANSGFASAYMNSHSQTTVETEAHYLTELKLTKRLYGAAAEVFNNKPKQGLESLRSAGLAQNENQVAIFLKSGYGLNKSKVGEYLGDHEPFSQQVLQAFANLFDFRGQKIVDALREFLDSFLLPGESQKIDRITEAFAESYYSQNRSSCFHSHDAVHIFTFSIIMLNTDQHSPQVKKRMTLEDFVRNNRGINENKKTKKDEDLPAELLVEVFDAIKVQEIKLKDDDRDQGKGHKGPGPSDLEAHLTELSRNVAMAAKHAVTFTDIGDRGLHDEEMFLSVWGPMLAAFSVILETSDDEGIGMEAFRGLELCSAIAGRFRLHAPLDTLVTNVSKLTHLLDPDTDQAIQQFSRSWKSQDSFKFIVRLGVRLGDHFRVKGWRSVLDCILVLLTANVVEITLEDMVLGLRDEIIIDEEGPGGQGQPFSPGAPSTHNPSDPESPAQEAARRSRFSSPAVRGGPSDEGSVRSASRGRGAEAPRAQETGSWLKGLGFKVLGLGNQRLRDEKLEAQQAAREALQDCDVKELLLEIRFLQADSLQAALEALLPDSKGPISDKTLSPQHLNPSAPREEGKPRINRQLSGLKPEGRDLGAMEMLIALSLQNRDRIDVIWPQIGGPLNEILLAYSIEPEEPEVESEGAEGAEAAWVRDPLLVRTCTAVLRLGGRMVGMESMREELLETLKLVLGLPDSVFSSLGHTLVMNLQMLVKHNLEVLRSCELACTEQGAEWSTSEHSVLSVIVSLLERLANYPQTWIMSLQTIALFVLHRSALSPQAFRRCVQAFSRLASSANDQAVAMKAVDYLYAMHLSVCSSSQLLNPKPAECTEEDAVLVEKEQVVDANGHAPATPQDLPANRRPEDSIAMVWVKVLSSLTDSVLSRQGDLRDYAMLSLEKAMLSPESAGIDAKSRGAILQACFEEVVWKLLEKLTSEGSEEGKEPGAEKLKVRSWILGCTLILRQLPDLGPTGYFPLIWVQFLTYSEKLLTTNPGPLVSEVVPQHLSNTLDVLELDGALGYSNPQLWVETWGRLDRFCPQIKAERMARDSAEGVQEAEGAQAESEGQAPSP